jgi:hypothetical protein
MNDNKRLIYFLKSALEKVSKREFKAPTAALIASLPSVLGKVTEIIADKNSTPQERTFALDIYNHFWSRLLKDESARRRESAQRTRTNARKVTAPPMSMEDFSRLLVNLNNEAYDELFLRLRTANARFVAQHGSI